MDGITKEVHHVVVTERTEQMPRITTTVHHSRVVALAWDELPPIRQLDLREGAAAGEDTPTCGDKASCGGVTDVDEELCQNTATNAQHYYRQSTCRPALRCTQP